MNKSSIVCDCRDIKKFDASHLDYQACCFKNNNTMKSVNGEEK